VVYLTNYLISFIIFRLFYFYLLIVSFDFPPIFSDYLARVRSMSLEYWVRVGGMSSIEYFFSLNPRFSLLNCRFHVINLG